MSLPIHFVAEGAARACQQGGLAVTQTSEHLDQNKQAELEVGPSISLVIGEQEEYVDRCISASKARSVASSMYPDSTTSNEYA